MNVLNYFTSLEGTCIGCGVENCPVSYKQVRLQHKDGSTQPKLLTITKDYYIHMPQYNMYQFYIYKIPTGQIQVIMDPNYEKNKETYSNFNLFSSVDSSSKKQIQNNKLGQGMDVKNETTIELQDKRTLKTVCSYHFKLVENPNPPPPPPPPPPPTPSPPTPSPPTPSPPLPPPSSVGCYGNEMVTTIWGKKKGDRECKLYPICVPKRLGNPKNFSFSFSNTTAPFCRMGCDSNEGSRQPDCFDKDEKCKSVPASKWKMVSRNTDTYTYTAGNIKDRHNLTDICHGNNETYSTCASGHRALCYGTTPPPPGPPPPPPPLPPTPSPPTPSPPSPDPKPMPISCGDPCQKDTDCNNVGDDTCRQCIQGTCGSPPPPPGPYTPVRLQCPIDNKQIMIFGKPSWGKKNVYH